MAVVGAATSSLSHPIPANSSSPPKFKLPRHPPIGDATTSSNPTLSPPGQLLRLLHPPLVVHTKLHSHPGPVFAADAKETHAHVVKLGLDGSELVVNRLALLYARSHECYLGDARRLFDAISERNVSLYAALIRSYCRSQLWGDALTVLGLMLEDGFLPDKYLVPTILRACCARCGAVFLGKMVHGYVIRRELEFDVVVGNSLIDMYANCNCLLSARRVFGGMAERDVVSWTSLLCAYADSGILDEAIEVFQSMQVNGVKLDAISWNAFISGLAQGGRIEEAILLLDEMLGTGVEPGISTWNGILSGCVQNGCFEDALEIFDEMRLSERPNAVTIVMVLQACSGLSELKLGKEIHAYAIKQHTLNDIFVCGSLISMYSKCGKSDHAERLFMKTANKNSAVWNEMIAVYANEGKMEMAVQLFDLMELEGMQHDLISYNTLLAGYARNGQKDEAYDLLSKMCLTKLKPNLISFNALISGFQNHGLSNDALKLFRFMQSLSRIPMSDLTSEQKFPPELLNVSMRPNVITISSTLSACGDLHLKEAGKEIHGYAIRNLLDSNVIVSSALVRMYMRFLDMDSATKTFQRLHDKNTVSWNILIAGHNDNGEPEVALQLYSKMLKEGFVPSYATILILLKACRSMQDWMVGRELHGQIVKYGYYKGAASLACALINMYTDCCSISDATQVFKEAGEKDVGVCNSMILGYAVHGMTEKAFSLFEQMQVFGIKPDHITFTGILSACMQKGLVEDGWRYIHSMEVDHGIKPTLEHCTCMVGLLGSVGLLKEALDYLKKMLYEPDSCIWATLLKACRIHSNVEIGETAANALFELEPYEASNFIILANIYSANGMWNSARSVKAKMKNLGLKIMKSSSKVTVGEVTYVFEAGETKNSQMNKILETWTKLKREMEGSDCASTEVLLVDSEDIDPFSCSHTEVLAICYGILSSKAHQPLRVSKNARMCFHCHTSAKAISKIEKRQIIVRDTCFYHNFVNGHCSCGDRW